VGILVGFTEITLGIWFINFIWGNDSLFILVVKCGGDNCAGCVVTDMIFRMLFIAVKVWVDVDVRFDFFIKTTWGVCGFANLGLF
jgi:hypothetical protein